MNSVTFKTSRRTNIKHSYFSDDVNPKTRLSYILLIAEYMELDDSYMNEEEKAENRQRSINGQIIADKRKKKERRFKRAEKFRELAKYFAFRKEFLTEEKEANNGVLQCTYCDRDDLVIGNTEMNNSNSNNKIPNLATIDHIHPLSKGGEKYNKENCCVSCKKCNRKKGNKILDKKVETKTILSHAA